MKSGKGRQQSRLRRCNKHNYPVTVICKQLQCTNDRFICGDCLLKFHRNHPYDEIEKQDKLIFTCLKEELNEIKKSETINKVQNLYELTTKQTEEFVIKMGAKIGELSQQIIRKPLCMEIDQEIHALNKLQDDITYKTEKTQDQVWDNYMSVIRFIKSDHQTEVAVQEKLLKKVKQAKSQALDLLEQIIRMLIDQKRNPPREKQPSYENFKQPILDQQIIAMENEHESKIHQPEIRVTNHLYTDKEVDRRNSVLSLKNNEVEIIPEGQPENNHRQHNLYERFEQEKPLSQIILPSIRSFTQYIQIQQGNHNYPIQLNKSKQQKAVNKNIPKHPPQRQVRREKQMEEPEQNNRQGEFVFENIDIKSIKFYLKKKISSKQPVRDLFIQFTNRSQNPIPSFLLQEVEAQLLKDLESLQLYGFKASLNQEGISTILNTLITNFPKLKYLAIPQLGIIDFEKFKRSSRLTRFYHMVDFDRRLQQFAIDQNFGNLFWQQGEMSLINTQHITKKLPNLQNISLVSCNEDFCHKIIQEMTSLQHIVLGKFKGDKNNPITSQMIYTLKGRPNIRCLCLLKNNSVQINSPDQIAQQNTSLKTVWSSNQNLRTVVLYKCSRKLVDDQDLKIIAHKIPRIQQLLLSGDFEGPNIWDMKFLKCLHLDDCGKINLNLCRIERLIQLQVLTLKLRIKDPKDAHTLMQKIENLHKLRFLNISDNAITTNSMLCISKLINIQTLICGGTRLLGSDLPSIVSKMKRLKKLSICKLTTTQGQGSINDNDMIQLSKTNIQITHLSIYSTKLTAKSISKFNKLQFLWAGAASDQWAAKLPKHVRLKLE